MPSTVAALVIDEASGPSACAVMAPPVIASSVPVIKRFIDVLVALVGLALTLPLYPFIMLAILIDSPGPVFYRQRRAGRLVDGGVHGRGLRFEEFSIIKFRTMRADAERATGAVLASERDPRISRVGGLLRRLRLDELPQFWNVLAG